MRISFLKIFKNEDFGIKIVEKGQICKPLLIDVCIEKSFDTIFNVGYGGGACNAPYPCVMGRENRPCPKGLKGIILTKIFGRNIQLNVNCQGFFYCCQILTE